MSQQRSLRRSSALLGMVILASLAGCQTQPASSAKPLPAQAQLEHCATNLHDLAGYMLQYYVVHRALPPKLDDLRPLVDLDRTLPLNCPVSGQPYVYVPDGLRSPNDNRWLLLYDATPHEGIRNAIVGTEPQGNNPLGLWVIQLDAKAFSNFRRPAPQLPLEPQ